MCKGLCVKRDPGLCISIAWLVHEFFLQDLETIRLQFYI